MNTCKYIYMLQNEKKKKVLMYIGWFINMQNKNYL